MDKFNLREFLEENSLKETLGGQIVYASSNREGMFQELVVQDKDDVESDSEETDDGTYICKLKSGEEYYYIDKVQ